jgi:hypothetical protein
MLSFLKNSYKFNNIKIINIKNYKIRKNLIEKICRYRNIFNNNFLTKKKVTFNSTKKYLLNIKDCKHRKMFLVIYQKKPIGMYGIKYSKSKYFLLDTAIRFDNIGPRSTFKNIGKFFVKKLLKFPLKKKIILLISKDNILANKIHEYGKYVEVKKISKEFKLKKPFIAKKFLSFYN